MCEDCAVFDAALIPKYAVVIVAMAVKAVLRIEMIMVAAASLVCDMATSPAIAAPAIATSPIRTTKNPAQERVIWTWLSEGPLAVPFLAASTARPPRPASGVPGGNPVGLAS
jgi:hypothetical protein